MSAHLRLIRVSLVIIVQSCLQSYFASYLVLLAIATSLHEMPVLIDLFCAKILSLSRKKEKEGVLLDVRSVRRPGQLE